MFATSRNASRRAVLISVVPACPDGVSRGSVMSKEGGSVDDECGSTVAEDGRAAEEGSAAVRTVELFHDDFLLADELVDDQRRPTLGQLDQHDLAHGGRALGKPDSFAQSDGGENVV